MNRRQLLTLMGGVGGAALLAGCDAARRPKLNANQANQPAEPVEPPRPPLPPTQSAPVSVFGADSSYSKISDALIESAQRELGGVAPAFWGRYFNHSDDRGSRQDISFSFAEEAAPLARRAMHVLPIFAQNTSHGSRADGRADGYRNAHDFIAAIGQPRLVAQGSRYIAMLNVEKDAGFRGEYLLGWGEGLARGSIDHANNRLAFLPSIYLHVNEIDRMADQIRRAQSMGGQFHGAWVALVDPDAQGGPAGCGRQNSWLIGGAESVLPGRVLLNQYRLDCRLDAGEVDFSSLNPALDARADFLDLLYQPRLENRGRA